MRASGGNSLLNSVLSQSMVDRDDDDVASNGPDGDVDVVEQESHQHHGDDDRDNVGDQVTPLCWSYCIEYKNEFAVFLTTLCTSFIRFDIVFEGNHWS